MSRQLSLYLLCLSEKTSMVWNRMGQLGVASSTKNSNISVNMLHTCPWLPNAFLPQVPCLSCPSLWPSRRLWRFIGQNMSEDSSKYNVAMIPKQLVQSTYSTLKRNCPTGGAWLQFSHIPQAPQPSRERLRERPRGIRPTSGRQYLQPHFVVTWPTSSTNKLGDPLCPYISDLPKWSGLARPRKSVA